MNDNPPETATLLTCAYCALLEPFIEEYGVTYYTCPHTAKEDYCIRDPRAHACQYYTFKHCMNCRLYYNCLNNGTPQFSRDPLAEPNNCLSYEPKQD